MDQEFDEQFHEQFGTNGQRLCKSHLFGCYCSKAKLKYLSIAELKIRYRLLIKQFF